MLSLTSMRYLLPGTVLFTVLAAVLCLGDTVALAQTAGGDEFVPMVEDFFKAVGGGANPNMAQLLQGLFRVTVGIGALLAVIMVAIGGIQYMTTDSSFKLGDARGRISDALIGLAIILLCVLVLRFISERLVSLDILDLSSSFVEPQDTVALTRPSATT